MRPTLQETRGLHELEVRPNVRIAHAGSLVISLFGQATAEDLDALVGHVIAISNQHEGHLTMIHVVPITGRRIKVTDELRARALELVSAVAETCRGSATVIVGTGLSATIIRLFLTGFNLLTKSPFPQKTFATVAEALRWAAQLPGQTADVVTVTPAMVNRHFGL